MNKFCLAILNGFRDENNLSNLTIRMKKIHPEISKYIDQNIRIWHREFAKTMDRELLYQPYLDRPNINAEIEHLNKRFIRESDNFLKHSDIIVEHREGMPVKQRSIVRSVQASSKCEAGPCVGPLENVRNNGLKWGQPNPPAYTQANSDSKGLAVYGQYSRDLTDADLAVGIDRKENFVTLDHRPTNFHLGKGVDPFVHPEYRPDPSADRILQSWKYPASGNNLRDDAVGTINEGKYPEPKPAGIGMKPGPDLDLQHDINGQKLSKYGQPLPENLRYSNNYGSIPNGYYGVPNGRMATNIASMNATGEKFKNLNGGVNMRNYVGFEVAEGIPRAPPTNPSQFKLYQTVTAANDPNNYGNNASNANSSPNSNLFNPRDQTRQPAPTAFKFTMKQNGRNTTGNTQGHAQTMRTVNGHVGQNPNMPRPYDLNANENTSIGPVITSKKLVADQPPRFQQAENFMTARSKYPEVDLILPSATNRMVASGTDPSMYYVDPGTTNRTIDDPDPALYTHEQRFYSGPMFNGLNDGKLWVDGDGWVDQSNPKAMERMMSQKHFRNGWRKGRNNHVENDGYNEDCALCRMHEFHIDHAFAQIPFYERAIYRRDYDRDAEESIGGFERDCIIQKNDMRSLLCRIGEYTSTDCRYPVQKTR